MMIIIRIILNKSIYIFVYYFCGEEKPAWNLLLLKHFSLWRPFFNQVEIAVMSMVSYRPIFQFASGRADAVVEVSRQTSGNL